MNPEQYYFLKDEPLHKDYDLCSIDTPRQQCALCVFSINSDCRMTVYSDTEEPDIIVMPFLKYLVEKVQSPEPLFQFPQFTYTCIDTDNSVHLQSEALLAITTKLGLAQLSNPTPDTPALETAYQGFLLHDNILYMFYNYDILAQHFTPSAPKAPIPTQPFVPASQTTVPATTTNTSAYTWGIIDELVFRRSIDGVKVDPAISTVFRANPVLWNIEYQGSILDFPFCLYGVEYSDTGEFVNEHSPTQSTNRATPYTVSKPSIGRATDLYVFGEEYGEMYLFSNSAIQPNDTNCVKYAVFVSGCKYLTDNEKHGEFIQYMERETSAVIRGGADRPFAGGAFGADLFGFGSDAPSDEDTTSDNDEEEENDYSEVPAIYFVEPKVEQQVWGVRQPHRFVAV